MLGAFIPRWNKQFWIVWVLSEFLITPTLWECCRCLKKLNWNCKHDWATALPKFSDVQTIPYWWPLGNSYITIIFTLETSDCRVMLFILLQSIDFSPSTFSLIASTSHLFSDLCLSLDSFYLFFFFFFFDSFYFFASWCGGIYCIDFCLSIFTVTC